MLRAQFSEGKEPSVACSVKKLVSNVNYLLFPKGQSNYHFATYDDVWATGIWTWKSHQTIGISNQEKIVSWTQRETQIFVVRNKKYFMLVTRLTQYLMKSTFQCNYQRTLTNFLTHRRRKGISYPKEGHFHKIIKYLSKRFLRFHLSPQNVKINQPRKQIINKNCHVRATNFCASRQVGELNLKTHKIIK